MTPEDIAISFAMHCDEHSMTTSVAASFADDLANAIYDAAEDRRDALRSYAPELIDDEDDDA